MPKRTLEAEPPAAAPTPEQVAESKAAELAARAKFLEGAVGFTEQGEDKAVITLPGEAFGLCFARGLPLLVALGYVEAWRTEPDGAIALKRGPKAPAPEDTACMLMECNGLPVAVPVDMATLLCFYTELASELDEKGQVGSSVPCEQAQQGLGALADALAVCGYPSTVLYDEKTHWLQVSRR